MAKESHVPYSISIPFRSRLATKLQEHTPKLLGLYDQWFKMCVDLSASHSGQSMLYEQIDRKLKLKLNK